MGDAAKAVVAFWWGVVVASVGWQLRGVEREDER